MLRERAALAAVTAAVGSLQWDTRACAGACADARLLCRTARRACASVYDITRRETFDNLSEVWMREVNMYATVPDCVKMLVANKARKRAMACTAMRHRAAR